MAHVWIRVALPLIGGGSESAEVTCSECGLLGGAIGPQLQEPDLVHLVGLKFRHEFEHGDVPRDGVLDELRRWLKPQQ